MYFLLPGIFFVSCTVIFICGISILSFLFLLLLLKKGKSTADIILIIWLLLVTLHLAFFYLCFNFSSRENFFFLLPASGLIILYTPLIYVYSLVLSRGSLPKFWYLHALPYLIFLIPIVYFARVTPEHYTFQFAFLKIHESEPFLLRQYGIYFAMITFIYTMALFRQMRFKEVAERSPEEIKNIRWLKKWSLMAMIFFISIFIIITVSTLIQFPEVSVTFKWVGFLITVYVTGVSLLGLKQATVFTRPFILETQKILVRKYHKSGLTSEASLTLAEKLSSAMTEKKYYLDPDLSLASLAEKLGVSAPILSQVINDHFKINFFDFVNGHRIREFKMKAKNPSNRCYTILGMALECGFKSKSSFNKIFKRLTSQNPASFLCK